MVGPEGAGPAGAGPAGADQRRPTVGVDGERVMFDGRLALGQNDDCLEVFITNPSVPVIYLFK